MEIKCIWVALPVLVVALPVLVVALPVLVVALPVLVTALPVLVTALPVLVVALPVLVVALPVLVAALPVLVVALSVLIRHANPEEDGDAVNLKFLKGNVYMKTDNSLVLDFKNRRLTNIKTESLDDVITLRLVMNLLYVTYLHRTQELGGTPKPYADWMRDYDVALPDGIIEKKKNDEGPA